MPHPEPVKVFISYSHKDERFREQLQEHLSAAKRQGLIEDWHDRRIAPGGEWEDLINENLETSDLILLLVSSSFIASPYCYDKEMQRALEKHESGQARVIPIILRPVDWSEAPFARLQALPRNGRPVSKWSNRDEAWMDVAKGIRAAVKQLRSERQPDTAELVDDEEEEEEFASQQYREVLANRSTPWEYVDFELNIAEGKEPRKYPMSARSPEGEAHAEMRFPFDEWQLKDKLRDLEVALLRSGGTRRGLDTAEERTVQEFGRALFEALFAGEIRVRYEASLHEARRQGKGLRLKLHVLPPELSALPWEFIYEPEGDYLVLSTTTPLVRYLELPERVEQLAVSPPLRILGMVVSPQGLPPLDVEHEKRLMEEAVKRLRAEGLVELEWLEGQSWRDLQRAMRSGPWHIFHFIGHGGFDPATEEGSIALSDEEGRKDLLRAQALARLLDDHFPLRLVFLNSCEGAKGSERDAFSSIAATLVRYGVPAVVAMQYEITDTTAIEFARNFYEAVADGLPVDAAATEARTAVSVKSALEWGTPVLYTRSSDGRIFDIQEADLAHLARQYRKSVEAVWADETLTMTEAQQLGERASSLGLSASDAADLEREVIGDTKEGHVERQELVLGKGSREKQPGADSRQRAETTAKADRYLREGVENGGTHPTDTIENGDVRGSPSSKWHISEWLNTKRLAIAGSITAIALIVGYFVVNHSQETAAIENLLTSHYEDVANGNYKDAFSDFSKAEQERFGGLGAYGDDLSLRLERDNNDTSSWCPAVDADVEKPEVSYLFGKEATGTVSVNYEHTCGDSPQKYNSQYKYVWKLSKAGGEWKLAERSDQKAKNPVYYDYPEEVFNLGGTYSDFGGEEQGNLDSIRVSNAVDSAPDGCGDDVEYKLKNLVDGRNDTTWQVAGTGVDEWIELTYDEPIRIGRLGITPGYVKTDPCDKTDRFYQMYVVRRAQITFDDGSSVPMNFERKPEMQFKNLLGHETTSLRITILDTAPPSDKPPDGPRYEYTLGKAAISEVKVEEGS
jgi:hypothetical protein